jgi:hypothetical protein
MKNIKVLNKHIHIISDEEIKAGDFYIDELNQFKWRAFKNNAGFYKDCKKIILTTDQNLIADGVQAIDNEFLQWFSENPSCEEVEVEEEDYSQKCRECGEIVKRGYSCRKGCFMKSGNFICTDKYIRYKIIIPKEEPKDVVLGYKTSLDAQMLDSNIKQETLEEAAERFYPISKGGSMWMPSADDCNKANKQEGFIAGAKWTQQKMYSEEEVKSILKSFVEDTRGDKSWVDADDEWFEQFKKK